MSVAEVVNCLEGSFYELKDFCVLEVTGEDRERFLSGQTSNDTATLEEGAFILNSRLDRGGKLKAFFYQLKKESCSYLVTPKKLSQFLKEDLEKFIIMDDVEIIDSSLKVSLLFSAYLDPETEYGIELESYRGSFGFLPAVFLLGDAPPKDLLSIEDSSFRTLCLTRGAPVLGLTAKLDQLVTDTVVNLSGVSLTKGCFLGQETVAKIETRRGGAYLPVALELDKPLEAKAANKIFIDSKMAGAYIESVELENKNFAIVSLLRNYRVEQKKLSVVVNEETASATVNYLPLAGPYKRENYRDYLFEKAVGIFQSIGNQEAIDSFKEVLKVDPFHEDTLESIGVIFGRMERFEQGLAFMDKVLEANPDSIMAHTNKSLFLMRLGKIEEAEEEKAQATVKSFASFGKVANDKKEQENLAKQKEFEVARRLDMFKQVLEMDPEDELANFGMADVMYSKGNAVESIPLLEKVLEVNQGYSVAYLLLGKCHIQLKDKSKAREVFEKGIEIASSKGDLMPANEMQSLLSGL
jgi:folate-binding Fe-S cluster repair protein YgfZ/Flp pilus assembly protein TadD